ncbi:MAG TPA: histidine ammonia-lyase, partial [Treponemataceae bacterium]|nr:histidine ammonia-lyase [Treponemataceae bacterium]
CLLAVSQALRLRIKQGELDSTSLGQIEVLLSHVSKVFPLVEADRPLETELRTTLETVRRREWEVLL